MILVIWILGLEQLDFRLEQGGEEDFWKDFGFMSNLIRILFTIIFVSVINV